MLSQSYIAAACRNRAWNVSDLIRLLLKAVPFGSLHQSVPCHTRHTPAWANLHDLDALMLDATIVSLKLRRQVFKQDARVDAVFLPLTCMFSLLVTHNGEAQMEMATIGKEGVVGAYEVLQKVGLSTEAFT